MPTLVNVHDFHTTYIGRGSVYGNPFTHLPLRHTKALVQVPTVQDAVGSFRRWAQGDPQWDTVIPPVRRAALLTAIGGLDEQAILGCYCAPPAPCHGRVIIELWRALHRAKSKEGGTQ